MFNIKVDLLVNRRLQQRRITYLVSDDRSLRCLSLLREDEKDPNDEGEEDGQD